MLDSWEGCETVPIFSIIISSLFFVFYSELLLKHLSGLFLSFSTWYRWHDMAVFAFFRAGTCKSVDLCYDMYKDPQWLTLANFSCSQQHTIPFVPPLLTAYKRLTIELLGQQNDILYASQIICWSLAQSSGVNLYVKKFNDYIKTECLCHFGTDNYNVRSYQIIIKCMQISGYYVIVITILWQSFQSRVYNQNF